MTVINELLNFPFTNNIDISDVPVASVMEVLRETYGSNPYQCNTAQPESEALDFYMSNHVIALLRTKTTEGDALTHDEMKMVSDYVEHTSMMATRAFAYLTLICTREMRHLKSASLSSCGILKGETATFEWIKQNIQNGGGSGCAETVWSGNVPFNMGEYTTVLEKMFRKGAWVGGGFGGPAWAEVTKCLRDYVNGTLTAEMMVDTVWTLCHNNGPIFNKGMLYATYTQDIYQILDVQRAGQVPMFQWSNHVSSWYENYRNRALLIFAELSDDPDLSLIKATAVHPEIWTHIKIKTKGFKLVKPGQYEAPDLTTQTVETDR